MTTVNTTPDSTAQREASFATALAQLPADLAAKIKAVRTSPETQALIDRAIFNAEQVRRQEQLMRDHESYVFGMILSS